jgi:hypothetical protein
MCNCMYKIAPSVVYRRFEHRACMVSVLAPSVVDRGFEVFTIYNSTIEVVSFAMKIDVRIV